MSKNTLKIYAADGLRLRETYYNVEEFRDLPSGAFSFKIGPNTGRASSPGSKPVKPGSKNISSESLILGKPYISNSIYEYSPDPD